MRRVLSGLYAVTPDIDDTDDLVCRCREALKGGASALQYRRASSAPESLVREQARELLAVAREHDAVFVVNDDPVLSAEIGADGVHIGQGDGTTSSARAAVGDGAIVGVTCHADISLARAAEEEGADYVSFGSVFSSSTKPLAPLCPPRRLAELASESPLPAVAIGGITRENCAEVSRTGVVAIAVVSALFGAPNVRMAAEELVSGMRSDG